MMTTIERPTLDLSALPYKPAAGYTYGRRMPIRGVCIHVAQCGEVSTAAENLMRWGGGGKVSWHVATDVDSITRTVREEHTAWSAPGANDWAIHVELAGDSFQTPDQWQDDFSLGTIRNAAHYVTDAIARFNIPCKRLDPTQVRSCEAGIFGHHDVTIAAREARKLNHRRRPWYIIGRGFVGGSHVDPGPHFPWDYFMGLVESWTLTSAQNKQV